MLLDGKGVIDSGCLEFARQEAENAPHSIANIEIMGTPISCRLLVNNAKAENMMTQNAPKAISRTGQEVATASMPEVAKIIRQKGSRQKKFSCSTVYNHSADTSGVVR